MDRLAICLEFSRLLTNDNLTYDSICEFINKQGYDFIKEGYLFLDDVFYNRNVKSSSEFLKILELLNYADARYSDAVYVEALWCENYIQEWVRKNLPRHYSNRHVEDIETY